MFTEVPMPVLDVYVNDRKLCRAGVGRDGVRHRHRQLGEADRAGR
jgi:hypothetical protein